ncbi:hypothetical protein [Rheinheimera gaetbuli]
MLLLHTHQYNAQNEVTQNTDRRSVAIAGMQNLCSLIIKQAQSTLINDARAPQWYTYIDEQINKLLQQGSMKLAVV